MYGHIFSFFVIWFKFLSTKFKSSKSLSVIFQHYYRMLSSLHILAAFFRNATQDPLLNQLSSLLSFQQRILFAAKNWKRITSGSGRIIFEYTPDSVLKLAQNRINKSKFRLKCRRYCQTNFLGNYK